MASCMSSSGSRSRSGSDLELFRRNLLVDILLRIPLSSAVGCLARKVYRDGSNDCTDAVSGDVAVAIPSSGCNLSNSCHMVSNTLERRSLLVVMALENDCFSG